MFPKSMPGDFFITEDMIMRNKKMQNKEGFCRNVKKIILINNIFYKTRCLSQKVECCYKHTGYKVNFGYIIQ